MTVFQDMGAVCMVEEVEKEPVERVVFKVRVVFNLFKLKLNWGILKDTSGNEVQESGQGLPMEIGK